MRFLTPIIIFISFSAIGISIHSYWTEPTKENLARLIAASFFSLVSLVAIREWKKAETEEKRLISYFRRDIDIKIGEKK